MQGEARCYLAELDAWHNAGIRSGIKEKRLNYSPYILKEIFDTGCRIVAAGEQREIPAETTLKGLVAQWERLATPVIKSGQPLSMPDFHHDIDFKNPPPEVIQDIIKRSVETPDNTSSSRLLNALAKLAASYGVIGQPA